MTPKNVFIGIDPGQSFTGVSVFNDDGDLIGVRNLGSLKEAKEARGADVSDAEKNNFQVASLRKYILGEIGANVKVKFILIEGPIYSGYNIQPVSIGSIHGAFWQLFFDNRWSFAILSPKSVNYTIFDSAKVTKKDTLDFVNNEYKDFIFSNIRGRQLRDTNIADAIVMGRIAFKFFNLIELNRNDSISVNKKIALSKGEKEVFLSEKKYRGKPKGLIFQKNKKYFLF